MSAQTPFLIHSELELPVKVKISCLEGLRLGDELIESVNKGPYGLSSPGLECFLTAQLFSDGSPIGVPIQTSIRQFKSGDDLLFNEWITFPALYRDVLPTSSIAITAWAVDNSGNGFNSVSGVRSTSHTFITALDGYVSNDPAQQLMSKTTSISNPRICVADIPKASQPEASISDASGPGSGSLATSPKGVFGQQEMSSNRYACSQNLSPSLLPLGGTCVPLFDEKGTLRLGSNRLFMWRNSVADGAIRTKTPHRHPLLCADNDPWVNGQVFFTENSPSKDETTSKTGSSTSTKTRTLRSSKSGPGVNTPNLKTTPSSNNPFLSSMPSGSVLPPLKTFVLPRPLALLSAAAGASSSDLSARSLALALALPPARLGPSSRLALQSRLQQTAISFVRSGSGPSRWLDKLSLIAVASILTGQRRQRQRKQNFGSSITPGSSRNIHPPPSLTDNAFISNTGWPEFPASPAITKAISSSKRAARALTAPAGLSQDPLTLVIDFPPFLFPVVYVNPSVESEKVSEADAARSMFNCPELHYGAVSSKLFSSYTNSTNASGSTLTPLPSASGVSSSFAVATVTSGSASEVMMSELLKRLGAPPKPTLTQIDRIREAVSKPILTPLSDAERSLLFTFRHSLIEDPSALSKLLRAVDWSNPVSSKQVIRLLARWAPLKPPQALELLMGDPSFSDPHVRAHAVAQLANASDGELSAYLLMLVQALRYEASADCPLAQFLIERTGRNIELCTSLNWYLKVETKEVSSIGGSSVPTLSAKEARERDRATTASNNSNSLNAVPGALGAQGLPGSYGGFVTNNSEIFNKVYTNFLAYLSSPSRPECHALFASIQAQEGLLKKLSGLCSKVNAGGKTDKKTQLMVGLLSDENVGGSFTALASSDCPAVTLPIVPNMSVGELIPSRCLVFKSAMAPLLLAYKVRDVIPSILQDNIRIDQSPGAGAISASTSSTSSMGKFNKSGSSSDHARHSHIGRQAPRKNTEYRVIYKEGDDLRQDQLVVQLISLMDLLLKQRNMDMRLTPYKVLATDSKAGFVEFVANSSTLRNIQEDSKYHNIANFLQNHNPSVSAMATAMSNYTYSLAGYCVVTYILSVGDRHLENIMLTTDGHLLHIDFGWCFGADPKPIPPPIRVTKDMMAALGNESSHSQETFRRALCDTFIVLRRNANLIITLLMLMKDANIPHLAKDKESSINTIRAVQDRFLLELNDDAACMELLKLLHTSFNALFPLVTDKIHNWVSTWR